ncbi:MAG: Yip1 family protein [Clostridiales bacterium]|jgi:hypothetical protein|nr:YIP1 family protein [Eubacteriales bacterium]MDH7564919.1 Yip1 family protein [Clostridiales bacterium]
MDDPVMISADSGNPGGNPEIKGLNPFQRVIGVITSPAETMKDLAGKPRILFPLLANALGVVGLYLVRFPLYQDFLRRTMEMGGAQSNTPMSPEQIEAGVKMASTFGLIATPITSLIMLVVASAIIFGAAKLLKGQGSFKQTMSVIGYSYVVTLLYLVLCAVTSFITGNLMLDASLANLTNLFLPDLRGSFAYGIIRGIDLFSIWYYIVMGIGIAEVNKFSKTKAYSIVAVIYIASILLGAGNNRFM